MVEKCQRALVGLQERSSVRGGGSGGGRDDLSLTMRRRTLDGLTTSGVAGEVGLDIKRDILAASLRQTDGDHRLDMIRKAGRSECTNMCILLNVVS